jgi:hypothetical protein
VEPAAGDVVKGADPGSDQMRDAAHDRERQEERERCEEEPFPPLAPEMEAVDPLESAQPASDLL